MKVLFATYPMAFHTPGGGEAQLMAYREHLLARGVEVTLLDPWHPNFLAHDVVHFFSTIGGSSHLCAFVKNLGLPLVVTSSLWLTEATAQNFPVEEIRHQLWLADRVVTNSGAESATLARVLGVGPEKFAVVRNAIDERFLRPVPPELFRSHFGIGGPFILNVANVEPRKNQARLVEAIRAFPDHQLILVGAARDDGYRRGLEAAGGSQVRYLGPIDHDSDLLVSAYAACSAFALPSLFETPGLAALEAAAAGARLVVTREGCTEEYFGDAAVYVDPLSVESIVQGLRTALQPPARPRYKPLIWQEAVADLEAIYAGVVAEHRRG
jgi:glycosyltransferase involved in cell wall biosynthesis